MKNWTLDRRYGDFYFAQATNEEEYVQLTRNLMLDMTVVKVFSCDMWEDTENLFNNDWIRWHELFETDVMRDELYDDGETEVPSPLEYHGNMLNKPEENEYPLVLMFRYDSEYNDSFITWYSL